MKNNIFVVSGPSGVGKGTVIGKVLEIRNDIEFSVSATTRNPRQGEVDGVNYYYISKEDFENKIQNGQMLEYTCYNGNYYGTPKSSVDAVLDKGKNVILDIEVEGAANVKRLYPDCVSIFILPPDDKTLFDRLTKRNTEDLETIQRRLNRAKEELMLANSYDFKIVNDEIDNAVKALMEIIDTNIGNKKE